MLLPLAISGISALAGLFGNKKQKQEEESVTKTDSTSTTTPQYDGKTLIMRDLLMDRLLGRTEDNNDVFGGYTAEGLNNINAGANSSQTAIENILASRGLGRTTAGANSFIGNQISRIGQQNTLLNSIPLLADQRNQAALNDASSFWGKIPIGQQTVGSQTATTKGSKTIPGNQTAGGLLGLGTSLAGMFGKGAFGGEKA